MRGDRGHLARVIRLDAADGHQGVAALRQRVGGEVLELARLVATEGQTRIDVLALGPDLNSCAQVRAQSVEPLQRRAAEGQGDAGEGLEGGAGHGTPLVAWTPP